jgi:hypothetical protein
MSQFLTRTAPGVIRGALTFLVTPGFGDVLADELNVAVLNLLDNAKERLIGVGEPSRCRSRPEPATDAMARVLIGAPD